MLPRLHINTNTNIHYIFSDMFKMQSLIINYQLYVVSIYLNSTIQIVWKYIQRLLQFYLKAYIFRFEFILRCLVSKNIPRNTWFHSLKADVNVPTYAKYEKDTRETFHREHYPSPRVSIEIDLFPCRNSKLIQTSFDQSPHPCKYFEYIWGRNYSSIDASFNASFPYTWNFVYIYDHHPTPVISSLPSRTWHAADSVSFDHWIADAVPIFMEIRCSKKGPSSRHVFSIIFQRWVEYRRWNSFLNFDPLHLSLLSFNFNFRLFDVMLWSNWKFEREFVIPHRLG